MCAAHVTEDWIPAGTLEALRAEKAKVIKGGIAVFCHEDRVYAVDNRCPHLGFPLHMGSLCDGILTCHWHHARFDVCSGGTLDPWADDVPSHDVKVEDGSVWVRPYARTVRDAGSHTARLKEGLEQNIGIVIAKAVVGLVESGVPAADIARIGIEYGTGFGSGWNSGLTILTAMTRVLPKLDKMGRILALYHGLLHVARGSSGRSVHYPLGALPGGEASAERLAGWYRSCIEVRDTQGAERVLLSAVDQGVQDERLADMMLAAATDHFYLDGGHTIDFHNKAFESLAFVGPEQKAKVLASLVPIMGNPTRSEELHQWQAPVNLVAPLKETFERLGRTDIPQGALLPIPEDEERRLLALLLGDEPLRTFEALLDAIVGGYDSAGLARLVALAAAERLVRFHTQNDFGDWIAVLHTFTSAHAVHESVRRSGEPLLLRAIFHGAAAVYLDRFLNVPAAARPKPDGTPAPRNTAELLELLDQRQQVGPAAAWVADYLKANGDRNALINMLGHALLREDAEFHTFQLFEAAIAEYDRWEEREDSFAQEAGVTLLLAATRYLAAHAPTARETPHTARIAWRLHRGEKLFEE